MLLFVIIDTHYFCSCSTRVDQRHLSTYHIMIETIHPSIFNIAFAQQDRGELPEPIPVGCGRTAVMIKTFLFNVFFGGLGEITL